VTDVVMPGMTGRHLADQARAGNASLVALRGDGTTLWEKRLAF